VKNKAVLSASWSSEEKERAKVLGSKIFKKPFRITELSKWLDETEKNIPHDRKLSALNEGM
jgi:hypothetical protein